MSSRAKEDQVSDLVFAGPFPPPIGGYTRISENFVAAWKEETGNSPVIIDTSPKRDKHEPGVGLRDLLRGLRVGAQMWWEITQPRAFIVFATPLFYQKLRPLIALLHRANGGPTMVWFSGGIIHEAIRSASKGVRTRMISTLKTVDRVIVETDEVREEIQELGVENVLAIPNPRLVDWTSLPKIRSSTDSSELCVVFFSRVVAEKGVFVLAEAVRKARARGVEVTYDIYGPVAEKDRDALEDNCDGQFVRYRGVFEGDAIGLMTEYDAVALPTWFKGEGHPGVIVEAMMAGIPVVTTYHKAIPELVDNWKNGVLVEPDDSEQLADVLCDLARNSDQIEKMGRAHRDRLRQHDAREAVRLIHDDINDIRSANTKRLSIYTLSD